MRCLHAPTNIANQAWSTARGLRALGHDAQVWHYGPNPFAFGADRLIDEATDPVAIVRAFVDALEADFDVYHFHFARSLFPARDALPWFWDLPVLRSLDKRILFTFHGTDVRLRSVHLEDDPWSYYRFADVPCDEDMIAARLDVIRAYADHLIVANPLNRRFVPEAIYVPKVVDVDLLDPAAPERRDRPVVVHVPSRRATKGTAFVLEGMEALERRGLRFDLRLAEGVPHEELLAMFREADLVVDNLLLGDCEVTALEAMALGKPVITRVRDEVLEVHPDLPAVRADPDTFVARMEELLADPDARATIGSAGPPYVAATHAPEVVASQLVALYEKPAAPTRVGFPGWTQPVRAERLSTLERRVQQLEAREGAQVRQVETERAKAARLQRNLEAMSARPEVRMGAALRRAAARLRRRR